jgi:hypothetical protein
MNPTVCAFVLLAILLPTATPSGNPTDDNTKKDIITNSELFTDNTLLNNSYLDSSALRTLLGELTVTVKMHADAGFDNNAP